MFQRGTAARTRRVLKSVGFSEGLVNGVGVAAWFGDVVVSLSDPTFFEMPFPDEKVLLMRHKYDEKTGLWVCADCGSNDFCEGTLIEFGSLREALAWVNCCFRKNVCLP